MAAGRDQHEAVPNSLLEGQSSPKVKTDPGRIEQAPNSNQNRRPSIFRGEHGPHPDQNHPAEYGDGWIGFNLLPDQAAEKINRIEELLKANGRNRSDVKLAVSPYTNPIKTDDLKRYRDAGVEEVALWRWRHLGRSGM